MKKEWMKYLNPDEISLFSLQFANCDRIEKNDAVYMFDEVGSGKTISAGLMAMQCLALSDEKGSGKNVLIITTPTLSIKAKERGSKKSGLFRDDWDGKVKNEYGEENNKGKLTSVIRAMGWGDRIKECNNFASNLEKHIGKQYALIIVDEAHLFLPAEGSETIKKQLAALYSLTADKVVIATATPIKYSEYDLEQYAIMAHKIIRGKTEHKHKGAYLNLNRSMFKNTEEDCFWEQVNSDKTKMREVLNSYNAKKEEDLCCCKFDTDLPVTRYFKDSISCLRAGDDKQKEKGIRAGAKVWCYDPSGLSEEAQLAKKIKSSVFESTGNKTNRMIVFFRLKEDVRRVGSALQKEGFVEYTGENIIENGQKTFAIVMGDKGQISSFAGVEKSEDIGNNHYFPDVLLVTYQKVEQGVNLQAYNYVLNYYIPKSAASLEQRYGRVDRIDSTYSHIYMCYWLGQNRCSEYNFYSAMFDYSNYLLASIPSRNILLSKEVLEVVKEANEKELCKIHQEYLGLIEKNPIAYLEAMKKEEGDKSTETDQDALQYLEELYEDFQEDELTEDGLRALVREQKKVLEKIKVMSTDERARLDEIVSAKESCEDGDAIFYRNEFAGRDMTSVEGSAKTILSISPIRCAKIIKESKNYKEYEEAFCKGAKGAVVRKQFKEVFDEYLLYKLEEGRFYEIFPYQDAGARTKENYSARKLEVERARFYKNLLLQAFDTEEFVRILSEMKISQEAAEEGKGIIAEYLNRDEKNAYEIVKQTAFFSLIKYFERNLCKEMNHSKYYHNPIQSAYTNTFKEEYVTEHPTQEAFCLNVVEQNGCLMVQASMLYKLVIVLLGVEKTRELLYESVNEWNRRKRCEEYLVVDGDGKGQTVTCTNLYEVPREQEKYVLNQKGGYVVDDALTYRIVIMHTRTSGDWIPNSIKTMRIALAEKYIDAVNSAYIHRLLQSEKFIPDFSEHDCKELQYVYEVGWLTGWRNAWMNAIFEIVKQVLEKECDANTIETDYISHMFANGWTGYVKKEEYAGILKTEWNDILWNRIAILQDIGWIRKKWGKEYLVYKPSGIGYSTLKIRERCPKDEGWTNILDGRRKILREYCMRVENGEAALNDERWKKVCIHWKNEYEILEWPFWKMIAKWVSVGLADK